MKNGKLEILMAGGMILKLLCQHEWTVKELTQELEERGYKYSIRSVYRYLNTLSIVWPVIQTKGIRHDAKSDTPVWLINKKDFIKFL